MGEGGGKILTVEKLKLVIKIAQSPSLCYGKTATKD